MKHMKFLSFFLGIAFAIIACSSNNETIPAPEVDPDGDDGTTYGRFSKEQGAVKYIDPREE